MTKENILNELQFIIDNIETIKQEGAAKSEYAPFAYAFGTLTEMVKQVAMEIPFNRETRFERDEMETKRARWWELTQATRTHEPFCDCAEEVERRQLGIEISAYDDKHAASRRDAFAKRFTDLELPDIRKPDDIPYSQKTLNPSAPKKIGNISV